MILTCPECATRYQTDAAQFPSGGRTVRCAKCGHVWHQDAAPPDAEARVEVVGPVATPESRPPDTVAPPQRTAYVSQPIAPRVGDAQPDARQPRSESVAIAVGWVGFALIVVGLGWSTIQFRAAIASAWPQSASLYAAIGMKVNTRGIDITDVVSHQSSQDGQTVLAIRGKLVNITGHVVSVPQMIVKLSDDDQHELDHWTFAPAAKTLKPGEGLDFTTRRTNPPPDARHLEVSFAEAGG